MGGWVGELSLFQTYLTVPADFNTMMEDFYRVIETSHAHQPGSECILLLCSEAEFTMLYRRE